MDSLLYTEPGEDIPALKEDTKISVMNKIKSVLIGSVLSVNINFWLNYILIICNLILVFSINLVVQLKFIIHKRISHGVRFLSTKLTRPQIYMDMDQYFLYTIQYYWKSQRNKILFVYIIIVINYINFQHCEYHLHIYSFKTSCYIKIFYSLATLQLSPSLVHCAI